MRDITGQESRDNGGEDSFSLMPAFEGKAKTGRQSLISRFDRRIVCDPGRELETVLLPVAVDGVHHAKRKPSNRNCRQCNSIT